MPRRRPYARRAGALAAGLLLATGASTAFGASTAYAGEATAFSCSGYGCDGHNPNIQRWQSGPSTARGIPYPLGALDLRVGITDGDPYAWARIDWPTGSSGGWVYVNRRNTGGGGEEWGLAVRGINESGWSSSAGTNTINSWSGMVYKPGTKQAQACVHLNSIPPDLCTSWY